MARLTFPSDRLVYRTSTYAGSAFTNDSGAVATVYSDAAGTTLADVQNFDGTANAAATFTVDTTSRLPLFLGPASGVSTLYVKVGTGPVTPIYAVQSGGGGGTGTVTSVASVPPDGTGNVPLTAANVGADASGAAGTAQTAAATDATNKANAAQAAAIAVSAQRASNLSDLASAPTARTNLGLGNVDNTADSAKPVSAAQAAADAAVVASSAQRASNLADLANAATARTNLGLGTASTHPAGDFALAGSVNPQTDMLGVGYGLLNGTPTTPYRVGTKYGANLWTVARMSSFNQNAGTGGVMNTSTLTPTITANGTNESVRTRINVSTGLPNSNFRYRLTFDVTTTAVTQSGFTGMSVTATPLDNSATACQWWDQWHNVWNSLQSVLTVQQGDRTLTSHRFVVEFDGTLLRSQSMAYIELALTSVNSISAGTISISNASLYCITETTPMIRACWSGDPTTGNRALFIDAPIGVDQAGYNRFVRYWFDTDGSLPLSPKDSNVCYEQSLTNSLASRYGAFTGTPTGGQRSSELFINNSDMVMAVTLTAGTQELRGNTHGGETGRTGTFTTDFKVYVDYDDGNGWVGPLTNYDLYNWVGVRLKITSSSKLTRSDQGSAYANVDRTFYIYPDGTIRQDRTVTWLQDQEMQWLIWHMASFNNTSIYIGRSGRGQNVLAQVDFRNRLAPPTITSSSTATTGGTLPGSQAVALSVTALSADGETNPQPKWQTINIPATTNTNTVTLNWTAVTGAVGYVVYFGNPGFERKVATVAAGTTSYVVTGSELPGAAPPLTNTAVTSPVYVEDCADSTADWACYYDPLSGAVFSQALDRTAFKANVYHALDIRASLELQPGGICKNYWKTVFTGSDLPLTIPNTTVMSGTVWYFIYMPRDPNRFEAEQTIRGGAVAQLTTIYGS